MKRSILSKNILFALMLTALCVPSALAREEERDQERPRASRMRRLEQRGDQAFVTNNYRKAMNLYERAALRAEGDEFVRMELKIARVYNLLQDPENTLKHYEKVYRMQDTLLGVNDACTYIDALRYLGRSQEAEVVARHYAFRTPYSRNQRFLNTLGALANLHRYYGSGSSDYMVTRLEGNTPGAEYWLAEYDGKLFCATSRSQMLDPYKVFFHRTEYYSIDDQGQQAPMRSLPREVQNGPAAFSGDMIVVTGIDYGRSDRITGLDIKELYRTQLYYSVYDAKRGAWSALQPLFVQEEGANYAQPEFINDGRSLLFASDRKGGFGGMDLYVSHWNPETMQWSEPVNLGPTVNTEGDEIYPRMKESELFFASNGLEGYGGFDIYRVIFTGDGVLPGSLMHFPYPINSQSNDYGMYVAGEQGYFISDRGGLERRDDIYTFDNAETSLGSIYAPGVSQEYMALRGELVQVNDLQLGTAASVDVALQEMDLSRMPEEGEVVLTLYYDFDQWKLTEESREKLLSLIDHQGVASVSEISVLGYADELGSGQYNRRLSARRAMQVAEFLVKQGFRPSVTWQGCGKTLPDPEDYRRQIEDQTDSLGARDYETPMIFTLQDRIRLNRTARRVDIVVKKK